MFKKILYLISFILVKNSYCCYTKANITTSNTLYTYQGNVYDITGYKHPGGKGDLLKTVGMSLEEWLDKEKYKFHYSKSSFYRDLDEMLVGPLSESCTKQVTTRLPTTSSVSVPTTRTSIAVTTQEILSIKPITNNSYKFFENFTLLNSITFLFAYMMY